MEINKFYFLLLRLQAIIILLLSFLIGIALNLYINIPTPIPIAFWMSSGGMLLIAHIFLGIMAGAIALELVLTARKMKDSTILKLSVLGFCLVCISLISGAGFSFLGAQEILTYSMAAGFFFSFATYVFLIVKISQKFLPKTPHLKLHTY